MQVRHCSKLVHCDGDGKRSSVSPDTLDCSLLVFTGIFPPLGLFQLCGKFDLRPLTLSKGFNQIRMDPVFSWGSDGISMRSSRSLLSAVVRVSQKRFMSVWNIPLPPTPPEHCAFRHILWSCILPPSAPFHHRVWTNWFETFSFRTFDLDQ